MTMEWMVIFMSKAAKQSGKATASKQSADGLFAKMQEMKVAEASKNASRSEKMKAYWEKKRADLIASEPSFTPIKNKPKELGRTFEEIPSSIGCAGTPVSDWPPKADPAFLGQPSFPFGTGKPYEFIEENILGKNASEDKLLSLTGVCAIISACNANGVLSFQFKGLQIAFKKTDSEPATTISKTDTSVPTKRAASSRHADLQEQADVIANELEYLKITDPVAFENFIQSEDVDDA